MERVALMPPLVSRPAAFPPLSGGNNIQICAEQDMRLRSTPLPLAAAARATRAVRG